MDKKHSFRYLVLSDFKRKYTALGNDLPNNSLKLLIIILIFILGSKGFRSVFFYRLIYRYRDYKFLLLFFNIIKAISFSIEIPHTTEIGEGFLIGHPDGIVINGNCIIGKNFSLFQGVTLGGNLGKIKDDQEAPWIGDNVFIGAGAKVLGPVKIGSNSIIGANSVVLKDIPPNSVAAGIPSKVIKKVEKNYLEIENEYKKRLIEQKKI